jgi:hypothetical protein
MAPIRPGRVCGIPVSGARTQDWPCGPRHVPLFANRRTWRPLPRASGSQWRDGDHGCSGRAASVLACASRTPLRLVHSGSPRRLSDAEAGGRETADARPCERSRAPPQTTASRGPRRSAQASRTMSGGRRDVLNVTQLMATARSGPTADRRSRFRVSLTSAFRRLPSRRIGESGSTTLRVITPGYASMPVSVQRLKASIFSSGQAPSQGIEPSCSRSRIPAACCLASS